MYWIKKDSELQPETKNIQDQLDCDVKGWGINEFVSLDCFLRALQIEPDLEYELT